MNIRSILSLLLTFALWVAPSSSHAQSAGPVAPGSSAAHDDDTHTAASDAPAEDARIVFRQAQLLLEGGQIELACETFERSLHLQSGVGTKFNLADCWQRLGRTASAHALFSDVVASTKEAGQSDRAALAQTRVDALTAVLSRVDLQLESQEDLTVSVDGEALPSSSLKAPIALNPGKHELRGERPGYRPWTLEVNVPAGPVLVVLVAPKSEALEPAPRVEAPPPAPLLAPASPASDDPVREQGPSSAQQALRYSLLGVGVIGLAAGATMAKLFYDSNEQAKGICPTSRNCTREEIDSHARHVADARNSRTWAWIGGGVGVGALVTSIVLWSSDSDSQEDEAALEPWLADADVGASYRMSF